MSAKTFTLTAAFTMAAFTAFGQTQAANHLVISEVGLGMPSGCEFTEIYNPTANPVDLTNYIVGDYNLYFNLPSIANDQLSNTLSGGSDHMRRFPAGTIIPSGGVVVVVNDGSKLVERIFGDDIYNFYNQPGSPQLFEGFDSDPSIPNMGDNYNPEAADYPYTPTGATPDAGHAGNINHTDAGENVVLFYWDGNSSLVKDIDMVQYLPAGNTWGTSTNQITDKSATPEIGPSGILENYAYDLGTPDSMTVRYPSSKKATILRRSLLEVGETHTGGNGINGDDETMEINNLTWRMETGHLTNNTCGVTSLGKSADNQKPVVGKAKRDIQFPVPGDTVHITVPVYDDGTFTARLMVDKGTGTYSPTTMTDEGNDIYGADISTSGLAEGTHVYWYVEVTDSGNLVAVEDDYQELPLKDDFVGYHSFMVKTTAYTSNDLIVTEVMYDPQGSNNYTHAQYFEIYNPATTPFDFGGFTLTSDYKEGDIDYPTVVHVPRGTIIPAKGYVVVTALEPVLTKNYPGIDTSRIINFEILGGNSFMAHAGSTWRFFSPNDFGFDENPVPDTAAFKTFSYTNVAPWPIGSPQNTGAGNTGYPIELTTLTPGDDDDPAKWAIATAYNGTPLSPNSVNDVERPGDVTLTTPTRSITYPTSADAIAIGISASGSLPITSAEIFVSSGGAFASTPMTTSDNIVFTANIGPFADNTLVQYYIIATDNAGNKGAWPYTAPAASEPFWVQNTPVSGNDIIFNEIMGNAYGGDNTNYPEFVEIYNRRNTPVNLSYYYFGQALGLGTTTGRIFPKGTIIPAHGYFVVVPIGPLFKDNYFSRVPDPSFFKSHGITNPDYFYNLGYSVGAHIGNSSGDLYLASPNEIDFFGTGDVIPFTTLTYSTSAGMPPNIDGHSFELIDPQSDPGTASNFGTTLFYAGTPGARNSLTPAPSGVTDWTLY